jgi:diguanylate cyclase (GGDEF)-like protein/PAS domain S-box-containing protein
LSRARLVVNLAACAAVAALVVWLFAHARSIDPIEHSRVIASLSQIEKLNSELDESVLKLRDGLLNNYDSLVATLQHIRWHQRELEQGEYAIARRGDARIDSAMAEFSRELAAKEALLERFKSRNALLKNSFLYLPRAVETLSRDPRTPQAVRDGAQALLRDVLLLRLAATPSDYERLASALERSRRENERLAAPVRSGLDKVLGHASSVLVHQEEVDRLVRAITTVDFQSTGKSLAAAYNFAFERRLEQANLSRLVLLLMSLGLAAYAAHSFFRLRANAAALNVAVAAQRDEIAERERAEQALRDQAEQLRMAQGMARMISMEWDIEADRIDWSGLVEWLLGPRPPSGNYPLFKDMVHPEERERFLASRRAALEGGEEHQLDYRIVRTDGELRWISSRGRVFRDAGGRALRMQVVLQDITERKRAEQALRESGERLRTIADNLPVLIGYVDADERYRFVNKTYESWFGGSAPDYVGRTLREVMGEEDYFARKPDIDAALAGEVVSSERRTRSHLREQYAHFTFLPHQDADGKVLGFHVLAYDVTERRRAAEVLTRERNLLLSIVDSLPDHLYVKGPDRHYLLINAAGREARGVTSNDEVVGKTASDFFPPQAAAQFDAEDQAVIASGEPLLNREGSTVDASGERRWHLTSKVPLRDPTGAILGLIGINRDHTEKKRAEQALRESEERYRRLFESNPQPMWVYDLDTLRFLAVNDAAIRHYGYSREEFLAMTLKDIRPPEDVPLLVETVAALRDEIPARRLWRHRKKDGSLIDVEIASHELTFADRAARLVLATDVTEKRRAEEQLRLAASALENAAEGVMVYDAGRRIVFVNKAFTHITGYEPQEVIGREPDFLRAEVHDAPFYEEIWNEVRQSGRWQGEIWRRRKGGEVYPEWRSISAVKDLEGRETHYVAVFTDIAQLKRDEARLEFLANHDALTRLPNRTLFQDRLEEALHRAHRHGGRVGLLFIDLDRFKNVNDSLGHGVGDLLLQAVAERLTGCVRETDTVARLGGDEFMVLLDELAESRDSGKVADKILARLAQPFTLGGHELFISGSIGISCYPDDGGDPQTLQKNADAAMYRAKQSGRNTYQFFSAEMNAHALESLLMANKLRLALENDELQLHYQPIIDLASGKVSALEALLRWQHPELGMVPPSRFIPLAEDSGLIIPIGDWVLKRACRQMKAWQALGIAPRRIAVNLSVRQFKQKDLAQRIATILERTGFAPQSLELEITESMVMQDPDEAVEILDRLHRMGICLAIDDFGTGYSSLNYLKRLPVDFLKIDRSFVREIPSDREDVAITRAVIALAKSLDLRVIAEGVETEAQRAFLEAEGCDEAQGYLFAKPASAADTAAWLQSLRQPPKAARRR